MNWFGASYRAIAAAVIGCAIGFHLYATLLASGWEAPWVVGVVAGGLAAAVSEEKNVMRGLLVGSAAVWTAAAAQAVHLPGAAHGLIAGLGSFHQSLTLPRASLFVANAAMAVFLGGASIRRATA